MQIRRTVESWPTLRKDCEHESQREHEKEERRHRENEWAGAQQYDSFNK